MNEFSKLALGQLKEKGLQVNEVNFADFKNLVKPVYKKWAPVLGPLSPFLKGGITSKLCLKRFLSFPPGHDQRDNPEFLLRRSFPHP